MVQAGGIDMPIHRVHLTTPIRRSFRAEQVAGMFDLPLDELAGRLSHTLTAELPSLDDDWTIGAIVGPSGSGKTTLARAAFGNAIYQPQAWPADKALIDVLDQGSGFRVRGSEDRSDLNPEPRTLNPLKHLLRLLTAVGLASPPSWLKPYRVLSTGERFRADVARAVLGVGSQGSGVGQISPTPDSRHLTSGLLVLDEFTSTLDRTVACTASYALGRFLRGKGSDVRVQGSERNSLNPEPRTLNPLRFVALSCHTDFLPWLAPDWVLDLGTPDVQHSMFKVQSWKGKSTLNCEPGTLNLTIERVPQKLWSRFAPHHYLSGGLSRAATCYAARIEMRSADCGVRNELGQALVTPHSEFRTPHLAAFCAVVAALGWKRTKRITRLVVLPEYQGLGIGPRLAEEVAAIEAAKGNRVTITASHPAILGWCGRSPRWRYLGLKKTGSTRQHYAGRTIRSSSGRAVAAYEWTT